MVGEGGRDEMGRKSEEKGFKYGEEETNVKRTFLLLNVTSRTCY